ncbi:MAG TPA: diguanylate cyclase [Noviherbaspirillum sp.]
MQVVPDIDKNSRRKKILIKYTMLVFVAYSITQIATLGAYLFGFSSVRLTEILFVASITLSSAVIFGIVVKVKKEITTKFANFVYYGQFVIWLVMYTVWFLSLREIRVMALFCALMALSFLLSTAKLIQSVLVTAGATIVQITGSYYAIVYLKQPGSFGLEVFYTLCFLSSALFICHLSDQYSRQRSELKEAKRIAEQNRDALREETEKAHRLNAELQKAITTIQEISIRDELTGLYNRRYLMSMLETEKKRADRTGHMFSVVILDVDHFKQINDTYGHLKGDEVLKVVAKLAQQTMRGTDFCARFGGEEFVMVLADTPENRALAFAERVRLLVSSAEFADGLQVTVSLGVAGYQPTEEISKTISCADEALYRAKHAGRNRVECRRMVG